MWKLHHDWAKEKGTSWYRSKEPELRGSPGGEGGYMSNKKWPLIEVPHTFNFISSEFVKFNVFIVFRFNSE